MKLRSGSAFSLLATAISIFYSANYAFAIERILSIGQNGFDAVTGSDLIQVNANDTFLIDLAASRSYVCEGYGTDVDTNFDWSTTVIGTAASSPETITATAIGNVVPIVAGETGGTADNRITLTPSTTDRFRLTVAAAKTNEFVRVRCFATTLFGGFNTNINDFNFLELTNIGNATITGTVTAITFDGTVALNAVSFTVPAQRRLDVDLHTAIGADKYGFVRVTHNGPLGTLQGAVSQYVGTTASFVLSNTSPLVPFEQHP